MVFARVEDAFTRGVFAIRMDSVVSWIGFIAGFKLIATRFRPIEEVTVPFALNIACPYLGVFYVKQSSSKDEARNKQGPSKEDFSKNHGFGAVSTPIYGSCPPGQKTITCITFIKGYGSDGVSPKAVWQDRV